MKQKPTENVEPKPADLDWLTTTLDCHDGSCMYRDVLKPRSGMRTNGGCRCFSDLDSKRRDFVRRMFVELYKLWKERQP